MLVPVLDQLVWQVVCRVLLEPDILLQAVDEEFTSQENTERLQQVQYLERRLEENEADERMLWKAYRAEVFDEYEYKARREEVKKARQQIESNLAQARSHLLTEQDVAGRKATILALCEQARASGVGIDAPYELKKRMIKLVVKRVIVNGTERWFRIEGAFRGTYSF